MPASTPRVQRITLAVACLLAVLSFGMVAVGYAKTGLIPVVPLFGGGLMLVLAVGGYLKLKTPNPPS